MLAPNDRRLLLDALAPPEGYALDQAIGTTCTLDLLALLRVPLAATALPWSGPAGGPSENPFALLTALRRSASRVSLYCHAGLTKVPARHVPLLTFLEDCVHPVTPPNPRGVFHPKLWLMRFVADDEPVRYRLLVLSRNLTFDRSWDIGLALDGELLSRKRAKSANRPLSEFVATLPGMARAAKTSLPEAAVRRAELMAGEVVRLRWMPPEGFYEDIAFHPIGHHGKPYWPVTDLYRLMVMSPFVGGAAIERLGSETSHELTLVGRYEELMKLDSKSLDAGADYVYVFDDQAGMLDVEGDQGEEPTQEDASNLDSELVGLHAKVFLGERHRRAVVFVGSPNATSAAFDCNVEFMVELEGDRTKHGIDAVWKHLDEANLLRDFPSEHTPVEEDPELVSLERRLEQAAHELGSGSLRASVRPADEERWQMTLHGTAPKALERLRLEARALSATQLKPILFAEEPCCEFAPTGLSSVTAFFALRISGSVGDRERRLDVVVRLPLEGAPEGRAEAVTAEMLNDRERLLRFMILLLSDEAGSDAVLAELERLLTESHPGRPNSGRELELGLPLLEPMLRTLHRSPERLSEVERLIDDLRTAGAPEDLLPRELDELWQTVRAVRAEM